MTILNKISTFISKPKKVESSVTKKQSSMTMAERENKIYGKDALTQQRLYEKWACKDTWLLFEEGIPLLFGIEPGVNQSLDDESLKKIEELWLHAKDCVQKKLLSVVNIQQAEKEWEVRPVDLYCWAMISRITVPIEFSTLMEFVSQTVKLSGDNTSSVQIDDSRDVIHQKHREIVLGAATSLLVNAPELCKNSKGRIMSRLIVGQIMTNANQWFGNDEPLLAESAMEDLINAYLKSGRPLVK